MAFPQSACHCFGWVGMSINSEKTGENQIANFISLALTLAGLSMSLARTKSKPISPNHLGNISKALIITAFVIGAYNARAGQILQISGDIKSEFFNLKSAKINSGFSTFDLIRDGQGWQIATTQPHSASHSIASDGQTTYSLIFDPNQTLPGNVGEIDFSSLPLDTPAEAIPWWFFVLTKSSHQNVSELPTPWTGPRGDAQAFFCRQEIAWSEAEPRLPASVTFFFEPNRVAAALKSPILLQLSGAPIPPQDLHWLLEGMQNNIKAGECLVTAWTNTPYGVFPLQFEVKVYNALVDYKMNHNNVMRIHYMGCVRTIHLADKITYLPSLQGSPIWTTDYRFRDPSKQVAFVRYGPQNYWTTNKNDVNLKRAAVIRNHLDTGYQTKILFLVRSILGLIFAASVFFLLWHLARIKRHG